MVATILLNFKNEHLTRKCPCESNYKVRETNVISQRLQKMEGKQFSF